MKKNSVRGYFLLAMLGFVMMLVGLMLAIFRTASHGIMLTLPYVCIGVGAGLFGGSLGGGIKKHLLNKDPHTAKKIEIEEKDERNLVISYKAKAKAYDLMLVLFGGILLVFALMGIKTYAILLLVATYLFVIFSMVYYLNKYHKEM
ncbi:hypothetical protein [Alkaliphilus transvaalensis]|uniref:hypothetical protein n=1 Tax=Alkaliphilus transvaalensis TaxID=114628 RepID=UPI00047A266B|nr:hypothetical protein [Alkaliphilus transvaalensis]